MADKQNVLPDNYDNWRKEVISLIESSKLKAIFSVNAELLALYWKIGNDILIKQREQVGGQKSLDSCQKA